MKKELRIKKNEEFSKIISHHKQVSCHSFILYFDDKKEDHMRVGISVSRKLGNAVIRNKIKRQVRMMCKKIFNFKEDKFDIIIIIRKPYLEYNYKDNINDLEKLYKKVII